MDLVRPEQLGWLVAWLGLALLVLFRERARRALASTLAAPAMLGRLVEGRDPRRAALRLGLVLFGGAVGLVALAGPRWGLRPERLEVRGVDVVFAVDLSASMKATDLPPSRIEAARLELGDMIRQLEGNRLGLVGFAGRAYAFAPLTLDSGATELFVEGLDPEAIPVPGTALGDAVRVALERLPDEGKEAFVVLLTDGEDHHSQPLEAAREAARRGVRLLVVGLGSPQGAVVPDPGQGGQALRDAEGRVVHSRLDEVTLRQMAALTGGLYVRQGPGGAACRRVVETVRAGQARTLEARIQSRRVERYQVFLALAVALILAGRLVPEVRA